MTGKTHANADALSWLLEPDSPGVRYLALRDLVDCPKPAELRAARKRAHEAGPIATVLGKMEKEGYWAAPGPGYNPKYRSSVWSVILLAQLGGDVDAEPRIRTACAYLCDHALQPGGQFSASGTPAATADCLQGNLCWAMLELGYEDPRLQTAFDWMARSVTGEDIAPAADRRASVRYYAGNCGPTFACGANNKLPCAWGGVKVLLAFSRLPKTRRTALVNRAIRQGVAFRPRAGVVSLRMDQQAQRQLVEVRLPDLLRDGPSAARGSPRGPGVWERPPVDSCPGYHPGQAGSEWAMAPGVRL